MRVLMLHNLYRAEGGEERAAADISQLLRSRGHEVEMLERSSDAVGRVGAAAGLLRGGIDPDEVSRAVRRRRADVVHAHNLHPLFGWRALAAARAEGAGTVLQLHNFRLYCAIGVAYRDGAPCHECRGRDTRPGLRHRCRGSLLEAAAYAAGLSLQQRKLLEHADALAVLSEAHGQALAAHGLPGERVTVLRSFVLSNPAPPEPEDPAHVLVAGRLVEEKGFDTAIAAARATGVPLLVAGIGPDEHRLRRLAEGADVTFAGWLERRALAVARARSAAVLAPSRCEEAFGYVVLDAIAAGVPALVSDRGGLPEMVAPEAVLPAEDVGAWAGALSKLWEDPAARRAAGAAARATAQERFGEDAYYERLIALYEDVTRRGR